MTPAGFFEAHDLSMGEQLGGPGSSIPGVATKRSSDLDPSVLKSAADCLRRRDPVLYSVADSVVLAYLRGLFAPPTGLLEAVHLRGAGRIAATWIRELPFDSGIFCRRMGRVEFPVVDPLEPIQARDLFDAATRVAVERQFEHLHLRLGAEEGVLIRAAEEAGFRTITPNAHFMTAVGSNASKVPSGVSIRPGTPSDEAALRKLAAEGFGSGTRFHLDPWLDPVAATELHERWAVNALRGEAADAVFCAVGSTGSPGGFVSVSSTPHGKFGAPPTVDIGLIAVASGLRRQGMARALVVAALRWARENGAELVSVSTEVFNYAACALYSACGFRLAAATVSLSWGRDRALDQITRSSR